MRCFASVEWAGSNSMELTASFEMKNCNPSNLRVAMRLENKVTLHLPRAERRFLTAASENGHNRTEFKDSRFVQRRALSDFTFDDVNYAKHILK